MFCLSPTCGPTAGTQYRGLKNNIYMMRRRQKLHCKTHFGFLFFNSLGVAGIPTAARVVSTTAARSFPTTDLLRPRVCSVAQLPANLSSPLLSPPPPFPLLVTVYNQSQQRLQWYAVTISFTVPYPKKLNATLTQPKSGPLPAIQYWRGIENLCFSHMFLCTPPSANKFLGHK